MNFQLNEARISIKVAIAAFLISLALAYAMAAVQAYARTGFDREAAVTYYRGDGDDDMAIHLPKTFESLVAVTHVHSFSQPMMLLLVAAIFCFSTMRERAKVFWIVSSFLGSALNISSPWAIRYLSGGCVILFPLSEALMLTAFLMMSWAIFGSLWEKDKKKS